MADEKSEFSHDPDHHLSLYSNGYVTTSGFVTSSMGEAQMNDRNPL